MDWCWINGASGVFRRWKDECLKVWSYVVCACVGGGFFWQNAQRLCGYGDGG